MTKLQDTIIKTVCATRPLVEWPVESDHYSLIIIVVAVVCCIEVCSATVSCIEVCRYRIVCLQLLQQAKWKGEVT